LVPRTLTTDRSAGDVVLNLHLIKAPRACIDDMLIHEFACLKHHDHGTVFGKLVDAHAGHWRKAKLHVDWSIICCANEAFIV